MIYYSKRNAFVSASSLRKKFLDYLRVTVTAPIADRLLHEP